MPRYDDDERPRSPIPVSRSTILKVVCVVAAIFVGFTLKNLWYNVDSDELVVIQSPMAGTLTAYTEPGWKWVGFGSVTHYKRLEQFSFSAASDQGKKDLDESLPTTFTDGGTAKISGVINWQMPLDPEHIIKLHKDFHSTTAIDQRLMRQAAQKVIFNIGPTMSSTESNSERRPDIPKFIDDQMAHGLYQTHTVQVDKVDDITGNNKKVSLAVIDLDDKGQPKRQSTSEISEYGIVLQPVAINGVIYDEKVKAQIQARQESITQVQISVAHAKQAEQDKITTEQQGLANAAKSKWEQEAKNATEIALADKDKAVALTIANRDLEVARLAAQTAEQYKQKAILEGQGEAAKRKLIIEADGALQSKLDAYVKVNLAFADALQHAQPGAWTPSVVMGGKGEGNGATSLVDLLQAKAAKDLGVNLQPQK